MIMEVWALLSLLVVRRLEERLGDTGWALLGRSFRWEPEATLGDGEDGLADAFFLRGEEADLPLGLKADPGPPVDPGEAIELDPGEFSELKLSSPPKVLTLGPFCLGDLAPLCL